MRNIYPTLFVPPPPYELATGILACDLNIFKMVKLNSTENTKLAMLLRSTSLAAQLSG